MIIATHAAVGAAPAFNNAAGGAVVGGQTTSQQLSWTHSVPAGGAAVVVALYYLNESVGGPATTLSGTIGGQALTVLSDSGRRSATDTHRLVLLGRTDVASGSKTITVTGTHPTPAYIYIAGVSVSYPGVTRFGAPTVIQNNSANATATLTVGGSTSGRRLVCGAVRYANTVTLSPNQRTTYTADPSFKIAVADAEGSPASVIFTVSGSYAGAAAVPLQF